MADPTPKQPKVALIVPFTSKDQSRIIVWNHVRSWLEQTLDYPLYVGEHITTGNEQFNPALARNHGAHIAGDWDIAIFNDADTVIGAEQIKTGVDIALKTGAVVYPYVERWELDYEGTKMLLQDEQSNWQSHMLLHTRNQPLGGCIIVRRDLWDKVRGFDSAFIAWGHEDGAFAVACEILSGQRLQRVAGRSLHLEHVKSPVKNSKNPTYQANKARIHRYLTAMQQPNAAELIRQLRDESVFIDAELGITWDKSVEHPR